MSDQLQVVYRAAGLAEAHLMCDALERAGVRSVVVAQDAHGLNEGMRGTVAGVRVAVATVDLKDAAEVVAFFVERRAAQAADDEMDAELDAFEDAPDSRADVAWPVCPRCRTPRTCRCPVCASAGTLLPFAEYYFAEADSERADDVAAFPAVLCATCDEPYEPTFDRRCGACRFDFGSGREESVDEAVEQLSGAGLLLVACTLAMVGGLVLYFSVLGRREEEPRRETLPAPAPVVGHQVESAVLAPGAR